MDQLWCFIAVSTVQICVLVYIHLFCEDKIVIRIAVDDKYF